MNNIKIIVQRISEAKCWFFEKINKTDELLVMLMKRVN